MSFTLNISIKLGAYKNKQINKLPEVSNNYNKIY